MVTEVDSGSDSMIFTLSAACYLLCSVNRSLKALPPTFCSQKQHRKYKKIDQTPDNTAY